MMSAAYGKDALIRLSSGETKWDVHKMEKLLCTETCVLSVNNK